MKVFIDTSILSLVFRRKTKNAQEICVEKELAELIRDFRVSIIGPIRQEILSGISDVKKFEFLKEKLSAFVDCEVKTIHYEEAARISNICRQHGIQGSSTDFLICGYCSTEKIPIFTLDKDFGHYSKYCEIKLHKVTT